MTQDLARLRLSMQHRLDELAHQSMRHPQKDPFEHGRQVGLYSAFEEFITMIDQTLGDDPDA